MRGSVPLLALLILGLLAPAAHLAAQPVRGFPPVQFQAEAGPFAEEIKQLEAATDKAARRTAFADVLTKAAKLKEPPEPLAAILRNRKPEETFNELLAWIKDTQEARVKSFLPLLITVASDSGEAAKPAMAALREYGLEAVDTLCSMLTGTDAAERNGAVMVAGKDGRPIGGVRGAARIVPHLVKLACEGPAEAQAAVMASLKKLTLLDLKTAEEWKAWLAQKTEIELMGEIGDRKDELIKQLKEKVTELERKDQQAEIDALVRDKASDPAALVEKLRKAQYPGVQIKAAELLKTLIPSLSEEAAAMPIDALGEVVLSGQRPDDLRIACVAALAAISPQASAGKAALAFAFVDGALAANGVSSELRLALVRALNSPLAARRLTAVLKAEIDEVHTRGGSQLETAIGQAVLVLAPKDQGADRDAILAEITRLLGTVVEKLAANNLGGPARTRYEGLAAKAGDTLQYLARFQEVDISACADALMRVAQLDSAAAGSALTALRASVNVPSARDAMRATLTQPPASETLSALYSRLTAASREALLVNLMGLYEALGVPPEPVEELRRQLLDYARQSLAKLPPNPDLRMSRRDAVRAIVARLATTEQAHVEMIQALFDCQFGAKDVVGYIQLLPAPRAALISNALRPELPEHALAVALLLNEISPTLTAAERDSDEHKAFRKDAGDAARKGIAAAVDAAITAGLDEEQKRKLQEVGDGSLRLHFVPATVDKLREKSALTEGRDAMAEVLLGVLRKAHPVTYDKITLGKLEARDFEAAIDSLKVLLAKDGYTFS